uniref:Negative elongation factor E n=1 Tax=Timema poppense TaxID=170557 RepID=A0A7R9GUT2_TIMPO|nr:unnamed protein product [Timema poppensis]
MGYLHFPTNLTEEELMLQAKYTKLKKKKKALQALKAPRPEPERTPQTPKRPAEARDAREVAKKLLKSGAITAITKTPKRQEQAGFKRPRGLERKLSSAERTVSGYQPFSATHPEDMETDNRPKVKNLYESFVSARDREERGLTEKREGRPDKPRQGNTIFVSGHKITEEFLRKAFHSCGHIVNVTMEIEKQKRERDREIERERDRERERSVSGSKQLLSLQKEKGLAGYIVPQNQRGANMNGSMVSGVQLKVSLARRQPVIQPINDASSSSTWSTLAASHSQKGSHKDKREPVVYDEDLFT